MPPSTKPSSNWLALQKRLVHRSHPRKRRKIDRSEPNASESSAFPRDVSSPSPKRRGLDDPNEHIDLEATEVKNGESIAMLRRMILGKVEYKTSQTAPGKYLALDCEMVGVGIEGSESSLARVSIVNYTGAIVLDVFIRQREKVVDYRTRWSGVRSTDLAGSAKPFKEVQQTVADLVKDRILVGHAIYNDLKALLLSHPSPQVRDTQSLAYKHHVVKSRRPALRVLVKQELGIVIQGGEHSSVTDARATMALFRLFKKQWESGFKPFLTLAHPQSKNRVDNNPAGKGTVLAQSSPSLDPSRSQDRKRKYSEPIKREADGVDEVVETSSPSSRAPSGTRSPMSTLPKHREQSRSQPPADFPQRKGTSSGMSTVTRRAGGIKEIRGKGTRTRVGGEKGSVGNSSRGGKKTGNVEERWWKSLGGGKKGGVKL